MADQEATQKEMSIITLANGTIYLGVLCKSKIEYAFNLNGVDQVNNISFGSYLMQRNLGKLHTVHFSATSDYTSRPLDEVEATEFEVVLGQFKIAIRQAKAFNENACFTKLFGKK